MMQQNAIRSGRRNTEMARTRPPVSAEAYGTLRLLWQQLAADADRITRAVEAIPPAMSAAALRPGAGATSAVRRIIGRLPMAPLSLIDRRRTVWRFLEPVAEPGEPPAIAVRAVLLGSVNRPPLATADFGLLVTRHSLARLFDQRPSADLVGSIISAHDHLLVLQPTEGSAMFSLNDIILPTMPSADGAFIAEPRSLNDSTFFVCKTWLSRDMLRESQARNVAGWGDLVTAAAAS